jgi:hypothetical protein
MSKISEDSKSDNYVPYKPQQTFKPDSNTCENVDEALTELGGYGKHQ